MENKTTTEAEIIARRTTFDGVTVYLHANGAVSDRLSFIRGGNLPADEMWRAADDFSIYTHAELPAFIRSVRSGEWAERRRRAAWIASGNAAAQVAANSRDRLARQREHAEYNRNPRASMMAGVK